MNKLDINCLKRFVKKSKKVSFTVGLMVVFLISGKIGYSNEATNTTNNFYFTIEDEKTGIEIGTDARARGKGSVATGNNSIAIGTNAVATGNNETKETIAQKLQENKDKIAEIANKKEEVKKYSNELQQLELKEKDVIAAGIRVEELRKAKEKAKLEYEDLNKKYLKDVEDSKSYLAEQQAKIDDLNSRLGAMSQIKGYNLNSEDGLEGAAKELKSKVEDGTSLNLSLDFYKEYAQNYYKAIGDLRQNKIIYDKIEHDGFHTYTQPNAKGEYSIRDSDYYTSSVGYYIRFSANTSNNTIISECFDGAIKDGLILNNKPSKTLKLYDIDKEVIDKETYEDFKKEKVKYIDSFNKFLDFTNDEFLTQEIRNEFKKQFEFKMDMWEKHAEIAYYQNNYEKEKNTTWLDKKKKSMEELENMKKTWSTFRPISEYKREEKEKFKQENITNVIEKNKYTVDTLTSELEKEMNINKNAVLEKEEQLANSKKQVEQAKKNWETINPTERDLLLSKEYERVKKELDNKKKTLLNAQERLAYLEKNLTLNDLNVGKNAIAIGTDTISSGVGAIAIGANSIATQEKTIAIGTENLVVGKNSAALGANNNIFATDSTTIGSGNSIGTKDADSFEYTNNNFILGNLSKIAYKSENSFLIGNNSELNASNTLLLGNNSIITDSTNGILIGNNSSSQGNGNITIGNNANSQRTGIAIGNNTYAQGKKGNIAIGNDSVAVDTVSNDSFVSFGHSINDKIYSYANDVERKVYDDELNRKLIHVATGEISKTSHEAVNGSQLYKLAKAEDDNIDTDAWKQKLGVGNVDLSSLNIGKGTIDDSVNNQYTVTGSTVKTYIEGQNFVSSSELTDKFVSDKVIKNNLTGTEIVVTNGAGAILGDKEVKLSIKDGGITLGKLDTTIQNKLAKTDDIGTGTIGGSKDSSTVTGSTVKNYVDSKNFTTNNYITDNYYNKDTVDTKLNNKADKSELNSYAKLDGSNIAEINKNIWQNTLDIGTGTIGGSKDSSTVTGSTVKTYIEGQNFVSSNELTDKFVSDKVIKNNLTGTEIVVTNGAGAILGDKEVKLSIKDGGITLGKLDTTIQNKLAKTDDIGTGTIGGNKDSSTVTGSTVKNYVDSKNFTTNNYITDNYYNKTTVDSKLNSKADKSELNSYAKVDASNISKDKWTAKLKGNIATATTDIDGFATAKNVQDYVNSQNFITSANKHDLKVDSSLIMSGNGAGAILGTGDIEIGIKDGGITLGKLDTTIQNKLAKTDDIGTGTIGGSKDSSTVTGTTVKNYVDNKTNTLQDNLNKKVDLNGSNIDNKAQKELSKKLSAGTDIQKGSETLTSGKQVKEYVSKEVEKVNMKAANIDGEIEEGDNRGVTGDKVAKVIAKTNHTMDTVTKQVITNAYNNEYIYRQTQANKQAIKAVNERVDKLDKKVDKLAALSQATANLDFGEVRVGNMAVGAGVSTYMGNQAVAVGVAYRPDEDWFLSAKWSGVAGDPHYNTMGGSISYQFNFK